MAFEVSKEKVEGLDVKECFMEGWNTFKNNLGNVFLASIFLFTGTILTLGILGGALFAGFTTYIIRLRAGDSEAKPTDVFSKLNILLPGLIVVATIFIASMANNIIIGGIFGWMISTLTGLLVGAVSYSMLSVSIPLLAAGKVEKATDAIQIGWDTFLMSPKNFLLLSVVGHALNFLGMLCLGVGVLLTAPVTLCAMAIVSEKLTKEN